MKHLLSRLINFSAIKIETPKQRLKKIANCFASPAALKDSPELPTLNKPEIDWTADEKTAVTAADTAFEKMKKMLGNNPQLDAIQQLRFNINKHIVVIANQITHAWTKLELEKRQEKIATLVELDGSLEQLIEAKGKINYSQRLDLTTQLVDLLLRKGTKQPKQVEPENRHLFKKSFGRTSETQQLFEDAKAELLELKKSLSNQADSSAVEMARMPRSQ